MSHPFKDEPNPYESPEIVRAELVETPPLRPYPYKYPDPPWYYAPWWLWAAGLPAMAICVFIAWVILTSIR